MLTDNRKKILAILTWNKITVIYKEILQIRRKNSLIGK